jgi:hypothetical protein
MKMLDPPRFAASSTRSTCSGGSTCQGYCKITGAEPTTLIPASRMRRQSAIASAVRMSPIAQYTAQSGWVASSASRSFVAVTPVVMSSPASSPASLPTFSPADTHTPVSSHSGSVSRPASASLPTLPVPR